MKNLLYKTNISISELENFKNINEGQVIYNIVKKYTVDGVCNVSIISLFNLDKALEVFKEEFENDSKELLEDANYSEEEIKEFINEDDDYILKDTYGSITLSDNTITMYITANKIIQN